MKIVHLLPALEQGGVETVVLQLNGGLVARGCENVVVSKGGRLVSRLADAGGRHIALDLKSKNPLTYFFRALALRRILRRENPDLVCVHSRVPAWLFVWANRPLGLRWITYAHGANSVSPYSAVMTKGDLTITPSRYLADYLKGNYPIDEARLRVIHPAVDAARFDPDAIDRSFVASRREKWGIAANDFVVMAVGRVTPLKGLENLVRAVALLRRKALDTRLVIVGDADSRHVNYLQALQALSRELDVNTVFAGGETKIPECLSIASVLVSANSRKPESFGLSMAEALMMNRPVVARAFGGALDVVRDRLDGVLVPAQTSDLPQGFADAIGSVREMTFGDLRQSAIERFNADTLIAQTIATYNSIVR